MRIKAVAIALTATLWLAGLGAWAAEPLELTYLANEGFLLRSGGKTVIIDGFVPAPRFGYEGLTPGAYSDMLGAKGLFTKVDLALTSHGHGDHFQGGAAGAVLARHPETLFLSSPQVIALLKAGYADHGAFAERLRPALPAAARQDIVSHAGIRVEVLRLSHGAGRFAPIQNLGHVIFIAERVVLHVGDAAMDRDSFIPYGLELKGIDVALIPYWYFQNAPGRDIIARHVRAREMVAVHIPRSQLAKVTKDLGQTFPEVTIFQERMETRAFGD